MTDHELHERKMRCVEAALASVLPSYRDVAPEDVEAAANGHRFHRGMHIGWAWVTDQKLGPCLDFLSEHRMSGMCADRYFADGTTEPIPTPLEARLTSRDPIEDAELERQFFDRNRAAYAGLRDRGLLPPFGDNLVSQDINEGSVP